MNKYIIYIALLLLGGALVYAGYTLNQPPVVVDNSLGANPTSTSVASCIDQNGLSTCVISGDFKNSTTTIASVENPFTATATWTGLELIQEHYAQAATTSIDIYCGLTDTTAATSTCPSGAARGDCYKYSSAFASNVTYVTNPSIYFKVGTRATGTILGIFDANLSTTTLNGLSLDWNGNVMSKGIRINPRQSAGCYVKVNSTGNVITDGGHWAAITSVVNGFDGKFKFIFER